MLARLGPEAGDALDEFLALTLTHEREDPPSLLAFLARLEGESLSIKRDMEAAGDAVRVMTVHAAKGLEAKIVFLPDTCGAPSGRHDPKLFVLGEQAHDHASGHLAWSPRRDLDPPAIAAARVSLRQAAIEEHNRLLYVALTRAEERLYIAGFHGERGMAEGCWHAMIASTDLDLVEAPAPWDDAAIVLERRDPGLLSDGAKSPSTTPSLPALPDWLFHQAAGELAYAPPVRPSSALGAADQQVFAPEGFDAERETKRNDAAAVGRLAHRLLQLLPGIQPDRRADAAARIVRAHAGLEPDRRESLIGDVLAVLERPDFSALFGPDSRAEVGLAGRAVLGDGRSVEITGQIDRISVTADAVLIADFKTGRPHPLETVPNAYVAQLALYRASVEPLYPGRKVRAFLVWTSGPSVLELPADLLDRAMRELVAT